LKKFGFCGEIDLAADLVFEEMFYGCLWGFFPALIGSGLD